MHLLVLLEIYYVNDLYKMLKTVDVSFSSASRPRNRTKQLGSNYSYFGPGNSKPHLRKLIEFEQLALYDTSISFGLFALIDTVLASLGEISHPDPDIQAFCRENVDRLGGLDSHSSPLYSALYKMLHCKMWSGFSATEVLFKVDKGALWIDDFVTYHPATITIRPNKRGRLIENEESRSSQRSGIYQSSDEGEVLLPLWKTILLTRSGMYGNYYGISLLESVYKWTILKEALLDMMAVALDRFGNPIIAITMPLYESNETEINPETGEERSLNTQELVERQIQTNQFTGGGNVLLLPQTEKDLKPDVKVLTTGNNIGSTFLDAIRNCDIEISKGLKTPYSLISNDSNLSGDATQQQSEFFTRIQGAIYKESIPTILSQSFHKLVKMNFTRESANIAPVMPLRQNTRSLDLLSLMQVANGLTSKGYLNPQNKTDWAMIRDLVGANDRPMEKEDLEFIKTIIIKPIENAKSTGGGGANQSRKAGTAGVAKGAGVGAGRPTGTSAPKTGIKTS